MSVDLTLITLVAILGVMVIVIFAMFAGGYYHQRASRLRKLRVMTTFGSGWLSPPMSLPANRPSCAKSSRRSTSGTDSPLR